MRDMSQSGASMGRKKRVHVNRNINDTQDHAIELMEGFVNEFCILENGS